MVKTLSSGSVYDYEMSLLSEIEPYVVHGLTTLECHLGIGGAQIHTLLLPPIPGALATAKFSMMRVLYIYVNNTSSQFGVNPILAIKMYNG